MEIPKSDIMPYSNYAQLDSPRGGRIPDAPWRIHPQPQLRRRHWATLNGTWDFMAVNFPQEPRIYEAIQVPYPPEARFSGFWVHPYEGVYLHYRKKFILPEAWKGGRVLLHFGAVDYLADVTFNGHFLGSHRGGYESFTFDITPYLQPKNTLLVRCQDDLTDPSQPYGKQVPPDKRGGMWYSPVSGIWQTVWLEWVPEVYISSMDISVTLDSATVTVFPPLNGTVRLETGEEFPLTAGVARIFPRELHHWTPETPYLYPFTLTAGEDTFTSYFALRTLETRTIAGIPRLCLNGKPYFFHGLLDQGYWPEGILTPPAPECFADDILAMKRLGFNTLRKHIKVEPEQFYYECDRLGMVVFQDMVNNGAYSFLRDTALPTAGIQTLPDKRLHRDERTRQAFLDGMKATVNQLKNHPCICYWTIFNEGWGQFDADSVYPILKALDPSRFVDATSGWFRQKKSDVDSRHIYFTPFSSLKASEKPLVLSEFGGYAHAVQGRLFNPKKSYGYRTCKTKEALQADITRLYMEKVLPAVKRGLCAAIYTQVSDVEDEINGLLTYDRQVCKVDEDAMLAIAQALQAAYAQLENRAASPSCHPE